MNFPLPLLLPPLLPPTNSSFLLCFCLSRFRATLYACPETTPERQQVRLQVAARIAEVESVLQNTTTVKDVALRKISQSVEDWQQKVRRERELSNCHYLLPLSSPSSFPFSPLSFSPPPTLPDLLPIHR